MRAAWIGVQTDPGHDLKANRQERPASHDLLTKNHPDSESLQGIHTMEVEMTMTSRRAILAGAAAIPALSLPAIGAEPDPIFAAIERARLTTSTCDELIDSPAYHAAHREWNKAHNEAFKTVPNTRGGAVALIDYAFEVVEREGAWDAMGDYGDAGGNNTVELLQSVAEFLRADQQVQS